MATKILKINQRARDDVSQNDHDILIMSFLKCFPRKESWSLLLSFPPLGNLPT